MTCSRDRVFAVIGSSFGLGYTPVAPGTAGALPGVGVFVLIMLAAPQSFQVALIALAFLAACALTVLLGPWAERHWGKKDPGVFVVDEVAGFLLTVLLFRSPSLTLTALWAFIVTRVFDITKPPPARRLEKLPGGWGILVDDLCTSLYAAAFLRVLAAVFPRSLGMSA